MAKRSRPTAELESSQIDPAIDQSGLDYSDDELPAAKRRRIGSLSLPRQTARLFKNIEAGTEADERGDDETELDALRNENQRLQYKLANMHQFLEQYVRATVVLEHRLAAMERAVGIRPEGPIRHIPDEMLYSIFNYLTLPQLLSCESICKGWQEVVVCWTRKLDLAPYASKVGVETFPRLLRFRNVEDLDLSGCRELKNDVVPLIATAMPNLRRLTLLSTKAIDFHPLANLPSLRYLHIGDCTEILDDHLSSIPAQIDSLKIEWCLALHEPGLVRLGHLTGLKHLELSQNDNLKDTAFAIPESLQTSLRTLFIQRQAFFNDTALSQLRTLRNLETLHLYWVPAMGTAIPMLTNLSTLRHAILKRMYAMPDEAFAAFANVAKNIQSLEFTGPHRVTAVGFERIRNLKNLRDLRLRCGRLAPLDQPDARPTLPFLSALHLRVLHLIDLPDLDPTATCDLIAGQAETLEDLFLSAWPRLTLPDLAALLARLPRLRSFRIDMMGQLPASEVAKLWPRTQ